MWSPAATLTAAAQTVTLLSAEQERAAVGALLTMEARTQDVRAKEVFGGAA